MNKINIQIGCFTSYIIYSHITHDYRAKIIGLNNTYCNGNCFECVYAIKWKKFSNKTVVDNIKYE